MIGQMVGSYAVLSKLGEGGMGIVYLAEHPLLRKKAVVKFLHAELSRNAEIVERFFNEARSATMIDHPGIVDVFDFGHHAGGCAFILMEFLDGESLADRARKARLDPAAVVLIGRQIASALGAAHERGIVHRDLKPDNVFLVPDRDAPAGARIKVLDFGIAKLAGEAAGAVKTQTGAVMGTPTYMAPEQCRSAGHVDHRADIYALGCILFELLCGRAPFCTQSLGQLIAAHMFEPPPRPSSFAPVAPDLEAVVLRALAKNADDRQQSMAELSAQLAACAASAVTADLWSGVAAPVPASAALGATIPSAGAIAVSMQPSSTAPRTTLGALTGQVTGTSKRPGRWWVAGVAAVVLAGGGVAAWQLGPGAATDDAPAASAPPIDASAADAPPPPPPAPPPPAAPKEVTIIVDSVPSGAAVIREHDGIRVGQTRFERTLVPVEGGTLVYLLRLDGYEPARVELAADRDGKRTVELRPVRAKPKRTTKIRSKQVEVPKQPPEKPNTHAPRPCPPGVLCPK